MSELHPTQCGCAFCGSKIIGRFGDLVVCQCGKQTPVGSVDCEDPGNKYVPRTIKQGLGDWTEEQAVAGPGTELKKIIPSLFKKKGCGCNDYAKKMDAWGPDGCEQRFDSIVAHLMQQAKQHLATRLIPEGITKRQAEKWVRQAIENSRRQ